MTTLDICVLLLGVLVAGLAGAGFLMAVYGYAFSEQSMREDQPLRAGSSLVENPLEPCSSLRVS